MLAIFNKELHRFSCGLLSGEKASLNNPENVSNNSNLGANANSTSRDQNCAGSPKRGTVIRYEENTLRLRSKRFAMTVHLCTRGEHRGFSETRFAAFRFISAHAENTNRPSRPQTPESVHLRARGEHIKAWSRSSPRHGSSPRTRRTLKGETLPAGRMRFISAHAENTPNVVLANAHIAVHLRARGEHAGNDSAGVRFDGSSPRTRRTLSR